VITEVPPDTPVTTPDATTTVATDGVLLLHVPPALELLKVMDDAWQNTTLPVIAAGNGLTVTIPVMMQPVGAVYVTAVIPTATADIIPDDEPIVAIAVLPLAHVPPAMALVKVAVVPRHSDDEPPMAGGIALTVIMVVT
jgi:hypothetical protein